MIWPKEPNKAAGVNAALEVAKLLIAQQEATIA
jgi:hypothetical protein